MPSSEFSTMVSADVNNPWEIETIEHQVQAIPSSSILVLRNKALPYRECTSEWATPESFYGQANYESISAQDVTLENVVDLLRSVYIAPGFFLSQVMPDATLEPIASKLLEEAGNLWPEWVAATVTCANCEEDVIETNAVTETVSGEETHFCEDCDTPGYNSQMNINTCNGCSGFYWHHDITHYQLITRAPSRGRSTVYSSRNGCNSCFDQGILPSINYCVSCDEAYAIAIGLNLDTQGECGDCFSPRGWGLIHEWDYRPALVFHPGEPANPKKPLYTGLELEISFIPGIDPHGGDILRWLGDDIFKDLVFGKEDSSVENGWEAVTHPMSPQWALENFPWKHWEKLTTELRAEPFHESTGTHIHMNKEAFSTAHLWKFLQIHFQLADFCGLVGGRGTNANYGNLIHPNVTLQREQLMEIVKKKDKAITDYQRYVAVNLRNEYTIELRYPRGGVTVHEFKKNLEWAIALYEFSDLLTIANVREGALSNPGYLLWYITKEKDRLPNLAQWVTERIPTPVALTGGN